MSLLSLASTTSAWRGYEYFKEKKVIAFEKRSASEIKGAVSGSDNNQYEVLIDIEHPRKSQCNCPHANGKRIICKHMVALYFSAFPKEAKKYYDEILAYEEEEEKRQEELENAVINRVSKMKKEELRQVVLHLLFEGPDWQYDRFVREFIEDD